MDLMYSILIESNSFETRAAILDKDNNLYSYFIERKEKQSLLGNIYCARVIKVIPGIRAAFLDIGMDKDAFLPATQVVSSEILDADFPKEQSKEEKDK